MKNNMIKIIKSVLVFLMFVVIFAAGFLLLNFFKNDGTGGQIFDISNDKEFMFLLAGVDSTGEDTGTRTDTLMLCLLYTSPSPRDS